MTLVQPTLNPAAYRYPLGIDYLEYLGMIHKRHVFDWYLEVGCRQGDSFAPVRSKTIAVDPFFKVSTDVIGPKPALFVFQQTSDDFFSSGFLQRNEIQLGLSFLDGMHLFEVLLRDIINAERNSRSEGVIALHDCCPLISEMTVRDYTRLPSNAAWTGDVWKVLPILQEYRPDIRIDVLDCRPTGLVLLSNLDPKSETLAEAYDEIVARYIDVEIEHFGVERYFGSFDYVDAVASLFQSDAMFGAVSMSPEDARTPTWVSF